MGNKARHTLFKDMHQARMQAAKVPRDPWESINFEGAMTVANNWLCKQSTPEAEYVFEAVFPPDKNGKLLRLTYTKADMDAVDTRLYPVFVDMFLMSLKDRIRKDVIARVREYWSLTSLQAIPASAFDTLTGGAIRGGDIIITAVSNESTGTGIVVSLNMYDETSVSVTDCGIRYSCVKKLEYATVKHAWLNTTFPGWNERLDTAVALGLDLSEAALAQYVFYPEKVEPTASTALPGVAFE